MTFKARFQEIFRSAFFELSGVKKRLLQIAIGLLSVGVLAQAVALVTDVGEPGAGTWSWSALVSGFGCMCGFILGAAFRIFLKLSLLLGGIVGLVLFGLASIGWIDLPWDSLSEIQGAIGGYISDQTRNLQAALTSYLPSSAMTGLGLASGVTQKPDMDPDD